MNNVTIIIFGATGDLTRRKLIPALYRLIKQGKLKKFIVVGLALGDSTSQDIIASSRGFIQDADEQALNELQSNFFYQRADFANEADFVHIKKRIADLEKEHGLSGNRIFYLAVAASLYCAITQHLATSGLAQKKSENQKPWHRIVYEKPFGHDGASSNQINECIKNYFDESQIYRIDHFLTKEFVSNIALVRFTNCVFEPLWNNRYIDQVQIVVNEKIGIEKRGRYYDHYGALADVLQNHVLELLALIAMESPVQLSGNYIRDKRVEVLEHVQVVDGILGQFDGYQQEQDVKPNSKTETFAAIVLRVDNPRWSGVPFYVKTGKCMPKKETAIYIKFKTVDCLLTRSCPVPSNWLKIEVSPEAIFSLTLNAKKPGFNEEVIPIDMEFCHSCIFGPITPEAYEVILQEVERGEKSVSVRFDEIECAWRIVDKIKAMQLPLYIYERNTSGPKELVTEFEDKHGMRWKA
jgi:glucose-6-phosphate 1-dehydrogenase